MRTLLLRGSVFGNNQSIASDVAGMRMVAGNRRGRVAAIDKSSPPGFLHMEAPLPHFKVWDKCGWSLRYLALKSLGYLHK